MEISGIYDNGPIAPVARIKENLSIWFDNKWNPYNIAFIEPIPRSSPYMVDFVVLAGATVIGANATIPRAVSAVLQMSKNELLHLRWEPLDDIEGQLFQLQGMARLQTRGGHARVSRFTGARDPYLATTTFFVMGLEKDAQISAINPNPVALPRARFAFFGYRYVLETLSASPVNTTYLPAVGRQ